jgi:2-C-methyl-D-erythritol 4-phosphate cytidylyltransferase/2-C-methyl-D-erythritol 2,4-cyclodiphosphate synthase
MKIIALIVAGGFSKRFNGEFPKQYFSIGEFSILKQTIDKFISSKFIDAVQVVIRPEDIDLYNEATKALNLLPVCFGGETRGDSVCNGLKAIAQYDPEFVLIHDACRPFLSTNLIDKITQLLKFEEHLTVIPAIAITETVKRIDNNISQAINRDNLFLIQTPQGFNFKKILHLTTQNEHNFTDESSLFEAHNIPIHYILGEKENIKITCKEDVIMNKEIRTGSGFDAHRFSTQDSEHNKIILGGIAIPYNRKLEAHSDGDVLIHALVDAILGSIGEGDIGMHFPPSDAKWKNADSKLFLIHTNELLKAKQGKINNLDITVICEKPRLGIYREQIRSNIAAILGILITQVNIKATTTEKMGFTGREEGIAVSAIVTISLPQLY